MKLLFALLWVLSLHNFANASMDPVYILKADMVCTNGKTISGYFSDYEFQEMAMVACEYDAQKLSRPILDSLLQAFKAVNRSERETFFGFTLYAKALTKDMFADSAYLGRYCFLLADNSDSIKWTDIKSVLNLRVEGAGMPEQDPLIQPVPFQMDATSAPIIPKFLFETIENQKVVNYFIYTCGEDATQAFMLINYNPLVTVRQLETWAKTLSQNGAVDRFDVLFAQKIVTIITAAE
jgi:hypothetical protein